MRLAVLAIGLIALCCTYSARATDIDNNEVRELWKKYTDHIHDTTNAKSEHAEPQDMTIGGNTIKYYEEYVWVGPDRPAGYFHEVRDVLRKAHMALKFDTNEERSAFWKKLTGVYTLSTNIGSASLGVAQWDVVKGTVGFKIIINSLHTTLPNEYYLATDESKKSDRHRGYTGIGLAPTATGPTLKKITPTMGLSIGAHCLATEAPNCKGKQVRAVVAHELGHCFHEALRWTDFMAVRKQFGGNVVDFDETNTLSKVMKATVGGYAGLVITGGIGGLMDFVAEYFAARMGGVSMPSAITQLYDIVGGPPLQEDKLLVESAFPACYMTDDELDKALNPLFTKIATAKKSHIESRLALKSNTKF